MKSLSHLMPGLALVLATGLPAVAQKHLEPIRPPGDGWIHADSACISSKGRPYDEYCPNGTYDNGRYDWARQEWYWFRQRPFPGSSKSRVRYEWGSTSPRSRLKNWKPNQVTVNCDTWESYFHTDLDVDVDWEPITPNSRSEVWAVVACPDARYR